MARPDAGAASAGFTLVEVLVALAILAVGFSYGFRALSNNFLALDRSGRDQAALALAENLLEAIGHDVPLRDGTTGGQTPEGLAWQVKISPYGDAETAARGRLVGHLVDVTAGFPRARPTHLVSVRLGIKAGDP